MIIKTLVAMNTIITIIWLVITIAFILSKNIKAKQLVIILVLHTGFTLAAYHQYARYKKVHDEYVAYAYEQYALDSYISSRGNASSWTPWPYTKDLVAEELEDKQDKLWFLFLGVGMLDVLLLLYIGIEYKFRYK